MRAVSNNHRHQRDQRDADVSPQCQGDRLAWRSKAQRPVPGFGEPRRTGAWCPPSERQDEERAFRALDRLRAGCTIRWAHPSFRSRSRGDLGRDYGRRRPARTSEAHGRCADRGRGTTAQSDSLHATPEISRTWMSRSSIRGHWADRSRTILVLAEERRPKAGTAPIMRFPTGQSRNVGSRRTRTSDGRYSATIPIAKSHNPAPSHRRTDLTQPLRFANSLASNSVSTASADIPALAQSTHRSAAPQPSLTVGSFDR